MIIVHAYCSYKLSPSGFQYGTFEITDNEKEDMYYLSDEKNESIVSSAFDYGIIKRLKGRLPNKGSYIFLFKKISYTYDNEHDDIGGDVSLNMALEFDDYKQFICFSSRFEKYERDNPLELAKSLADCISPDIKITKYKLTIRKNNIDNWLKSILGNLQDIETNESRLKHYLTILTDSFEKNLYCKELQEIFNFDTTNSHGDEVEIMHLEGAWYIYPKKKRSEPLIRQFQQIVNHKHLLLKILVLVLIVFLIVTMMIIILKIKNSNNIVGSLSVISYCINTILYDLGLDSLIAGDFEVFSVIIELL